MDVGRVMADLGLPEGSSPSAPVVLEFLEWCKSSGIDPDSSLTVKDAIGKAGIPERSLRRYLATGELVTENPKQRVHRIRPGRLYVLWQVKRKGIDRAVPDPAVAELTRRIDALLSAQADERAEHERRLRAVVEDHERERSESRADGERRIRKIVEDNERERSETRAVVTGLTHEVHDLRAQVANLTDAAMRALPTPAEDRRRGIGKRLSDWWRRWSADPEPKSKDRG